MLPIYDIFDLEKEAEYFFLIYHNRPQTQDSRLRDEESWIYNSILDIIPCIECVISSISNMIEYFFEYIMVDIRIDREIKYHRSTVRFLILYHPSDL